MKSICNSARLFRSHDNEKGLPTDPMLPCPSPHRQVAAALSAAVTTTKFIGNRPHLAWAHKSKGSVKPIPSYSSGEGVWGRGASLREAASPPASPQKRLLRREREGGDFSIRKVPSLATLPINPLRRSVLRRGSLRWRDPWRGRSCRSRRPRSDRSDPP